MSVVRVLDSSVMPTASQVAQAKAAGYEAWLGYLGKAGDNLLDPWTAAAFATVRAGGLLTGAYCSGDDTPAWVKATAASYGLTLTILDVEGGIRPDGTWVDPWLDTAGSGIYGLQPVMEAHHGHGHPCYVGAADLGTSAPGTWSAFFGPRPTPPRPTGWQHSSGQVAGVTVDFSNFDSAIFGQEDTDMMLQVNTPKAGIWLLSGSMYVHIVDPTPDLSTLRAAGILAPGVWTIDTAQHADLLEASRSATPPLAASGLTATQAVQLASTASAVARIEQALKGS